MLVLLLAGSASALYDNEAQTFLGLINNYRAQNTIGALSIDASLQDSANWMSNDMLTGCVAGKYTCSHTDSTGRAFDQRLRDSDIRPVQSLLQERTSPGDLMAGRQQLSRYLISGKTARVTGQICSVVPMLRSVSPVAVMQEIAPGLQTLVAGS